MRLRSAFYYSVHGVVAGYLGWLFWPDWKGVACSLMALIFIGIVVNELKGGKQP